MIPARVVLTVVTIALAFAAGGGCGRLARRVGDKPARRVLYYVDPMHPAYRSDKPGNAPDCGMKLEPVFEEAGAEKPARRVLDYVDPMHPAYRSDKPGNAPDCGRRLEPVFEEAGAAAPHGHGRGEAPLTAPGDTLQISAEKQRLIGIRYSTAELASGERTFRTTGRIAVDETRMSRLHSRVEGWIDEVFVDFIGKAVEKGSRMLTIYSPEMLATQPEYVLALKSREMMKSSTLRAAREHADSLLEAARGRLELWDLSEAQIEELARSRKPVRNITLFAPAGGFVISRNAFPKQRVTPETELYAIADLSNVWIVADVFESETGAVRIGQAATVTIPFSGRALRAVVSYVLPQVDPETRTLKVRLDTPNPDIALKPDMFVDVEFRTATPRSVTVPAEAVLDTGLRQTVFIDRGEGSLEIRQVETGERIGGRVEIRSGLKAGERVVTSGNFLLDSESQLKRGSGHD